MSDTDEDLPDVGNSESVGASGPDQAETAEEDGLSRRDVFKAGAVAALLGGGYAAWEFLGDDGGPETLSNQPFGVWKEIQKALRTSSTHLPARADKLVEEGDAEGVYDLVRNDIVTLPAAKHEMGEEHQRIRWGPGATLRCGAGTQREQAELLATLYERMGYETRLRVGTETILADELKSLLYDPPELSFDPDVDVETTEEWLETLDIDPVDESTARLDVDGEESTALGESVLDSLEPLSERGLGDGPFYYGYGTRPLVVEASRDDETVYADLFSPTAAFDDPVGDPSEMGDGPSRTDPGTVSVTLSARKARSGNVVDFVSGEWSQEELAGRQLRVQTLPTPDPIDMPSARFVDIQQFFPALSLQGANLSREEAANLSVTGDAVTRNGDKVSFEGDTITRNGTPTISVSEDISPADIESLDVEADAAAFPTVRLNLYPRDENGNTLGGLGPDAFTFEDNGETVPPTLVSNQPSPRVMVLYDTSGSMPSQYADEELESFIEDLRADIEEIDEGAVVTPQPTTDWADTGGYYDGAASHLWEFITNAPKGETNLVVFITDGQAYDEKTPEIEQIVESGPPVIGLDVQTDEQVDDEPLAEMADLSGGRAIPAADREAARQAIGSFIRESRSDLPGYIVEYEATDRVWGEHSVSVAATGDGSATAETTYQANAPATFGFDRLDLTLQFEDTYGNTRTVERTIAGEDGLPTTTDDESEEDTVTEQPADGEKVHLPDDILEVEGALFGETIVSFEGWGVPFAVWADDVLSARLSYEPVHEALTKDSAEKANQRRKESGLAAVPSELLAVQQPYPDAVTEDSLTYPDGLRVAIHHQRPSFVENASVMAMDILPLAEVTTAADDGDRRFRLTTQRTARAAVTEQRFYDASAANTLDGANLATAESLPEGPHREALFALSERATGRRNGYVVHAVVLADAENETLAHWEIRPETGEVRGILPDASGGGRTEQRVQDVMDRLNQVMAAMNLYIGAAGSAGAVSGAGAVALGAVAAYGQFLGKLYAIATIAIATMDASGIEDEIRGAVISLICNLAKGVGGAAIKRLGQAIVLQNLVTATGGSPPDIC